MYVSLLSIGINLAAVMSLLRYTRLGHAGLALSTSAVALVGFAILFEVLRRRIGGIDGRKLAESAGKVIVASAGMGLAIALLRDGIEGAWGISRLARLAELSIAIPAGLVVFYTLCRLMRVSELELALSAAAGPLRRLTSARRAKIL
jgi:putative peptidoglycan lipid II flippase